MVPALCSLLRDPLVGKILIQSEKDKTPKLFFYKIPKDLSSYHVLLLDPLLGSGNTVTMAIRCDTSLSLARSLSVSAFSPHSSHSL
jgi:uridine kinase